MMRNISELERTAYKGLEAVMASSGVKGAEVYASANGQDTLKLLYTSHKGLWCNGVEEPKLYSSSGVSVKAVFVDGKTGFGRETQDISINGVLRALEKARQSAIYDEEFVSLPEPSGEPTLTDYHDKRIMELNSDKLLEIGWDGVIGAVQTFKNEGYGPNDGLILNGDITVLLEQMAVANSNGVKGSDQTTILKSFLTSMIEGKEAKGCGWSVGPSLDNFSAHESGVQAAITAIKSINPQRIDTGEYPVILGPQAVTDIMNLLVGNSKLDMIDMGASIFYQKHGQKMFDEKLSITDDGSVPGYGSSKSITCEGLPTGRTELIKNGILVGYLTNDYFMKKVTKNQEKMKEVFGVSDPSEINLAPRNGFRFYTGGRLYEMEVGIWSTNLFIEGDPATKEEDLIKEIKDGVFIRRTWYLYPIGGYASPEFTGTVIGDSYIIKNGKVHAPLKQNSLRIHDSFLRVFGEGNIIGITGEAIPTMIWNSEGVVNAPYGIGLKKIKLQSI